MARRRLILILALSALTLLGVVALISMALGGPEPRGRWGYIAATAALILSACQTAPALAFATRIGRGYWAAPLRRVADVLALAGVISAPTLLVVLFQLPNWLGRPSIWFEWPGAPRVWDGVAIVGLTLTGAALTYCATSVHIGATSTWTLRNGGLVMLGAFYTMLLVYVHLLVSSDMALSLVPAWHSAVIPAYHTVSGFEAAIALVVLLTAFLRRTNPATRFGPDPFHATSKLMLALGLLWFYFAWCEFLTYWYGRTPDEQALLSLFMFGPGAWLFLTTMVCEFLVPFGVLLWNPARTSARTVTSVAAIVLIGSYVDRLRIYVGAWSVATNRYEQHLPDQLAPLPLPGPAEMLASVGMLAATALITWLALRTFGVVDYAEIKAVQRLTPMRRLLRRPVEVVARPS